MVRLGFEKVPVGSVGELRREWGVPVREYFSRPGGIGPWSGRR